MTASLPVPDADTLPYVDLLFVTTIVLLAVTLAQYRRSRPGLRARLGEGDDGRGGKAGSDCVLDSGAGQRHRLGLLRVGGCRGGM